MIMISKENPLDGLSEDLLDIEVATTEGQQAEVFVSALIAQVKREISVSPTIRLVDVSNLHLENISIKTTKFRDER